MSSCCWSLPAAVGASAAIVALLWRPPIAFIAAVVTHIASNASISPYSNFKKWNLEKIALRKWWKCINPLNLHLFQESIQNWQLKKTKTRIEFHLQGYFGAVSPSLQIPNSRAWKGSNKLPSNTVMCLSAWKNRFRGGSEDTCFIWYLGLWGSEPCSFPSEFGRCLAPFIIYKTKWKKAWESFSISPFSIFLLRHLQNSKAGDGGAFV